ncbi:histidinol-phosphatase [Rhodovulum sp. 12E13]|uniref:inositol monophosphatase family protein n=1 Tax=Rhodovulum sp. 12E13 TaxID=2203891 RepID=UPI000E176B83|nr:inositol monophosphatase family protein [Rhodovulum sp. 12E13]RDC69019.1 histidinol-phosphatase [Rhodovulum sp. 12E13]
MTDLTRAAQPPALSPDETRDIVATAAALADAARAETLPCFRAAGLGVDNKATAGFDPVTEADRAAEAAMRRVLAERRPADGILGEEMAGVAGRSGRVWVLDPIDGTRAFMIGAPTWGTLIALCDGPPEAGGRPLYGLIDQPHTGERWAGGLGRASLAAPGGESRLGTRPVEALEEARLCTTFPEVGSAAERAAFARVAAEVRLTRYGLDCYAYGLLASGHVDLVIEAGLAPYDICAPIAVIEAAGGIVTDWRGSPAQGGGRVLAAANAGLHEAALRLLPQA